jgi:glycosyltransferase involved in cell wall biosynthesis
MLHPVDTALRLLPGRLKGERWARWGLPVRRDMWNEVPVLRETPAALQPMVQAMREAPRDERVRVLVLHPQLIAGGAEAVLLNLLAHVDRSRFEMHLITTESTPGSSVQDPWLPRFATHAASVHSLPSFLDREYFLRFIIDFIESNRIDVLLVSLVPYGYHALAQIRRACPRLAVVDLLHAEAPYIPMDSVRLSTTYRHLIDRRVVISDALRSLLIDKYGESPDRVSVIPNFIDTAIGFDPAKHPPGALKREVGLADETSVVLFFGRLAMEKQPLHIVEVAELMRSRSDVAFVLLGDGPERRKVEDEVARRGLGNVFIRPAREAVADALADAKLTICPSKLEGVPMAGIESLAMGKPVVAARVPGWIEMITDGQDGFLIEDRDFPGYVRAIETLLDDPVLYARMSEAARRGAVARFSVPECLSLWEGLFADAAADAAAGARP